MTQWKPKDPDETVAYVVDWSDQLGDDPIASYTFTRLTGTVTTAKQDQNGQILKVWLAGGVDGETATFLMTVTTTSGQVLERSFALYVGDGQSSYLPATTTKRQLVDQMFTECSLNGWEYDLDPSEKDTALTRLDMLMWELRGRDIEVGYNFPPSINAGSLDDELGCPDQAFSGLAILGAERLCPTMGKTMSKESRIALAAAMKAVRNCSQLAPAMRLASGTPAGSGNKPYATRYPFSITR